MSLRGGAGCAAVKERMREMSWIKIETTLPQKPETIKIAAILKKKPAEVVGALVVLWCLTDGLTEDGFLQYYGRREIDAAVGVRGFCAALEQVGWIELGDDGARLVNYDKHNGRSAKMRAETARRVGRRRARGVTEVTGAGDDCNGDCVTDVTEAALAREEKSREYSLRESTQRARRVTSTPSPGGFVPPSEEAVGEVAAGEGFDGVEASKFWLWQQARGWAGVVDWRAALRLWMARSSVAEGPGDGDVPGVRVTRADVEVG